MDNIIYIAIIFVIFVALFGEKVFMNVNKFIWSKEKPEKIRGIKVKLREFDCLGLNPPKQIRGIISYYENQQYRIDFDEPFINNGKEESYAIVRARHAGYPVSKMSKYGILAIGGEFESGHGFIACITKENQ